MQRYLRRLLRSWPANKNVRLHIKRRAAGSLKGTCRPLVLSGGACRGINSRSVRGLRPRSRAQPGRAGGSACQRRRPPFLSAYPPQQAPNLKREALLGRLRIKSQCAIIKNRPRTVRNHPVPGRRGPYSSNAS